MYLGSLFKRLIFENNFKDSDLVGLVCGFGIFILIFILFVMIFMLVFFEFCLREIVYKEGSWNYRVF